MLIKDSKLLNILKEYYLLNKIPKEEINIFGIRYEENQNKDIWNDFLGIWSQTNCWYWLGTTDPGRYFTENKEGGAAHLCTGYHNKIWQAGIHGKNNPKFAHPALVQTGNKVKIWRDKNKNYIYEKDADIIETGYFGINFHRASALSNPNEIGMYSAGCQVTQDIKDFEFALNELFNTKNFKQNKKYCFSYMLFNNTDLKINLK